MITMIGTISNLAILCFVTDFVQEVHFNKLKILLTFFILEHSIFGTQLGLSKFISTESITVVDLKRRTKQQLATVDGTEAHNKQKLHWIKKANRERKDLCANESLINSMEDFEVGKWREGKKKGDDTMEEAFLCSRRNDRKKDYIKNLWVYDNEEDWTLPASPGQGGPLDG